MAFLRPIAKIGGLLLATLATVPGYAQPALSSGSPSFPVQYVGAPISQTLTYSFSQPFFLFTPLVLTGGVTGGDFQMTGGTCVTGNFGASSTCTVTVQFTPSAPGLRMGAVLFPGANNTVAAVTYLYGVGWGSLPSLSPILTTYSPPLTPTSVALDGGGTVYLGGQGMDNGALTYGLWNLAGNMFATQAFAGARGIVIDGAGYSYVSDTVNQCIWQTTPILPSIAPATVCLSLPAAWSQAGADLLGPLAVDGSGNIYAGGIGQCATYNPYPYCQYEPYTVFEFMPSTGNWSVASDLDSDGPLATDGAGNLYTAGGGGVYKVPPNAMENRSQWIRIYFGWSARSLAVDGEGTVFVLDNGNQLWKVPQGPWPYSNPQPAQLLNTASLGLGNWVPGSIAIDGAGNAYVTDSSNQKVYKLGGANFISTTVTTDGVCGSANGSTVTAAPAANLCSTGTASAVTGAGPWSWTCAGTNGGQTASCSASAPATPLNGSCGSSNGQNFTAAPAAGLCSVGTPSPVPVAGSGPWSWDCLGLNGGANSPLCSASLTPSALVNGACNTALTTGTLGAAPSGNLCSAGTASAVNGSGPWNWTCTGFNGGTTASCTAQPASSACASGTVTLLPNGGYPVRLDAHDSVYYGGAWVVSQQDIMTWSGGGWQVAITPPVQTYIGPFGFDAAGNAYVLYGYTTELHVFNPAGKEIRSLTIPGIINYYGASRLAVDRAGNVYVSSTDFNHGHQLIKKITPAGVVTTILGLYGGWGCSGETDSLGDGCPASQLDLVSSDPIPMTVDAAGNLYFAYDSSRMSGVTKQVTAWVRKIDAATGIVTLVAGGSLAQENQSTYTAYESGDGGPAIGAAFLAPVDLAVDFRGNLYLTDGYYVRRVDGTTGIIQTVTTPGVSRKLGNPYGPASLAVNSRGDLYVGGAFTPQGNPIGIYVYAGVVGGNCVTATAVAAACGTANHTIVVSPVAASTLCAPGSFPSGVAASGGSLNWTCFSLSNGSPASCSGAAPPQLTVTAGNNTMIQGSPLPSPLATISYNGFWNGEGWWVLAGAPSLTTTATSSSPPGNYPITITQGTLDSGGRYNFTFVAGTLSVLAPPTVQLSLTASFTTTANGYQAVVTVTNNGGADAINAVLSSATLGTAAGSPLPQTQAKVSAGGGTGTFTVTFPSSAGAHGAAVPAKFSGTYNGGSFSLTLRSVTLP